MASDLIEDYFDSPHDVIYGGLPSTAGGFISEITGGMLAEIIMNLHTDDEADAVGTEILESNYDTDKIESIGHTHIHQHKSPMHSPVQHSKNKDVVDEELIESEDELIESEDELIEETPASDKQKDKMIKGGGNVLEILVSLIPTVFPKAYM